MKSFAVLVCGFVAACNYDTGECYLRDEGGAGVGGSIITPTGAGGFGDVPPEPQDATDPADPCSSQTAECTVTWKSGSAVCKQQGTASSCTTLYQGAHATLDEAKKQCEKIYGVEIDSEAQSCGPCHWATSANNDCYDKCDAIADKAREKCNKMSPGPGQAKCNQAVEEQRTACYTDCKNKK
jgi:hypothetical protein